MAFFTRYAAVAISTWLGSCGGVAFGVEIVNKAERARMIPRALANRFLKSSSGGVSPM